MNKAKTANTEAPFIDLHLSNGFVSSQVYDKRDDFDFDILLNSKYAFYARAFRNQNFMVIWFTNLRKLKEGMIFLSSSEKIITRYRRTGYKLNVMRQSVCLVFNPIMVDNYAVFFNCTPVCLAPT